MKSVLALFLAAAGAALAQTSLNVSHDLTVLKIAAQNMTANVPDLDSRPLLEAAVQYAQSHSIPRITADPGSYYFLTGHPFGVFLFLNGTHDLTLDLAGSDLYFALGSWNAVECLQCKNVQFLNFTVDALQLPFTQVQVTSVDTARGRIFYSSLPGWEAAANFNTVRNPFGATEPLYAFDFRKGQPVRQTSRMAIQRPIDAAFLSFTDDGSPWGKAAQLASLQPGDILALTARAGGPTFVVRNSSNVTVRNVAIYYGGQVGIMLEASPNSTVELVQVTPRPGTDRMVSSNADGIGAVQVGENLVIRRCRVKRTGDDGISPNSQQLAVVTGQTGTRQVTMNRSGYSNFANNLQVQFIDNKTGMPAATARITQQTPAYSTDLPVFGSAVTLTLDQDLPALAPNTPMVYADPAFRGSGLLIENSLVEENLFARGISVWGVQGGTLKGNVLRKVAWSGINPIQRLSVRDWMTGPIGNLAIRRNVIEQFSTAFGVGNAGTLAGIELDASDANQALISNASPFSNVTVQDNFVSTGPYSGIRMQNVNGGSATGNLLMNVVLAPGTGNPGAALLAQLGQPLLAASNSGVTSTPNTVDSATAPAFVTSAVSYADDAIAPDSRAAIFGTRLAPQSDVATAVPFPTSLDGVTVTVTDSAGIARAAQVWFISPGQIDFLVPSGCASGAAVVTVAVGGTPSGRGGILIDSIAPALFSVDGSGTGTALGAAVLARADGSQVVTTLAEPVSLGQSGDVAVLVLYGTGLRNRETLEGLAVYVGNRRLPVQYGAAQGAFAGLDQINVALPAELRGAGAVALRVTVNGLSSNSVAIRIQ
jgi:uncharacterized protein (TIGR03437 family)